MKNILVRLKALADEESQQKMKTRIPGSFTAVEYADATGIAPVTARAKLLKLVQQGKLKHVRVPIRLVDGIVSMRNGYVLIEENDTKRHKNSKKSK